MLSQQGRDRLRVLFTCSSYVGHFLPMLPLARALVAAGHEVAFASGPVVKAEAERAGLAFFLAGPDQLTPQQRVSLFPELGSVTPNEMRRLYFGRLFAQVEIPLRAPGLTRAVEMWKPDVLVHEVAELAAPLVATSGGLPYATHSYGPLITDDVLAAAANSARQHWLDAGLEAHPRAGLWEHLYLDICPAALQHGAPQGAPAVQEIRPADRSARAPLERSKIPTCTRLARKRSLVYVTMGTVFNTDVGIFRTVLGGLAGEPVDVVVTVGPLGDPAALAPQPPNVRVERFIPQAEVLRECSAVITHGGAGTTFSGLAFGCPLLMLPQGADQFVNAERVVAAGAGLQLPPDEVSAAAIRSAMRRLLHESSFAEAALRISDEIATMPSADEAVLAIERLPEMVKPATEGREQRVEANN